MSGSSNQEFNQITHVASSIDFCEVFFWNVIIEREIVHSQFKLEISPPEGRCIISHGIEW